MAALKKQQHIERLRAFTKKLGDAPKLPKGSPYAEFANQRNMPDKSTVLRLSGSQT